MQFAVPSRRAEKENTLPLINVVFLLLIFFMVSGHLSQSDHFLVTPPHSSSEVPPGGRDLVVHIDVEGRIALEGKTVAPENLTAEVVQLLGDGSAVHLKADGAADAASVVSAMESLRAAGVERLHLLTLPGSP